MSQRPVRPGRDRLDESVEDAQPIDAEQFRDHALDPHSGRVEDLVGPVAQPRAIPDERPAQAADRVVQTAPAVLVVETVT